MTSGGKVKRLQSVLQDIVTSEGCAGLLVSESRCILSLRAHAITGEVVWQTDWGEESGGSNTGKLGWLQEHCFAPLGAQLARYPKGRKEYNGRVERSHRTDDEEFCLPCL